MSTQYAKPMMVGAGDQQVYNITASTLVKAGIGRLARVSVVTAGSAAGAAHDCAAIGDAAAGNKIASIPNAVGVVDLDWPCGVGIVIVPGTGQVLAVAFT